MEGQTSNAVNLKKKWIVYNTMNNSLTGWHSFMDSYILDFINSSDLKIKTLGDSNLIDISYRFDSENGIIYEDNGNVLYCVLKVDNNKLSLKMGEKSNTIVSLVQLDDRSSKLPLDVINNLLCEKVWIKENNSIRFTNETYKVVDQIETNFKVFVEKDENSQKEFKGAWLLDSYDGMVLLELYSERHKLKSIYQITNITKNTLNAISTSNNGESLILDFNNDTLD